LLEQQDAFLECCLASAVRQTVPCEILIIISPETPRNNLEIVHRYRDSFQNVDVLMRERPTFAAAINTGIWAAKTDRVSLLFTDDWLQPNAVDVCLPHDSDIVSASMAFYDATGQHRMDFSQLRSPEAYRQIETFVDKASYIGHFLLLRREKLLEIGGVDETIGNVGPDDFDMIWSLLEHDATVAIVEEEVYACRDHAGARLTLRPRDSQIGDLEKILDKHGMSGAERRDLIDRHARWFGKTLQEVMRSRSDKK
jgi:hypothetical protein